MVVCGAEARLDRRVGASAAVAAGIAELSKPEDPSSSQLLRSTVRVAQIVGAQSHNYLG